MKNTISVIATVLGGACGIGLPLIFLFAGTNWGVDYVSGGHGKLLCWLLALADSVIAGAGIGAYTIATGKVNFGSTFLKVAALAAILNGGIVLLLQ